MFARAGQPLQKGLMYFIDYSNLYQYKREEGHQSNSFQKAMGNMHVLYASNFTIKEKPSRRWMNPTARSRRNSEVMTNPQPQR